MPGRLLSDPLPRRRLSCCRPLRRPFPSGSAWVHSLYCRTAKNRKLDRLELVELGVRPAEPIAVLTPAEADRLKPTGELALETFLRHRVECRCYACGYTDAHADDQLEGASRL